MSLTISYGWDDETEREFAIAAKYEVCDRCRGTGTHVNPSIDGHGISGDDECWDDDAFRSMYFGGGFDVTCERCDGRNVVLVVDESRASPEQLAHYYDEMEERWRCDEISRMERMYGA